MGVDSTRANETPLSTKRREALHSASGATTFFRTSWRGHLDNMTTNAQGRGEDQETKESEHGIRVGPSTRHPPTTQVSPLRMAAPKKTNKREIYTSGVSKAGSPPDLAAE